MVKSLDSSSVATFCRYRDGFLVDLIVAKNLHLAAEQLRGAAVSHRQHATAMTGWS